MALIAHLSLEQEKARFSAIGTLFEYLQATGRMGACLGKRGIQMSVMSSIKNSFAALTAALALSALAVGSAVGPAYAAGTSVQVANA